MMKATRCPLGGPREADEELYAANFDPEQLHPGIFSARRLPDRLHYRMVRNRQSGTIRSDPILDSDELLALYRDSRVTYSDLADYTRRDYLACMTRVWPLLSDTKSALEIGCGHGFFLKELATRFDEVAGCEPSWSACEQLPPDLRSRVHAGFYAEEVFPADSFSFIGGFQVLDHVPDPNALLSACLRHLRPKGLTLWVCHDVGAPLNRLLGEKSPIVDVEHTVLYDRATLRRLFSENGFEVVSVFPVSNRYPLSYWHQLAPLPHWMKSASGRFLAATGVGAWPLRLSLGNMGIVARKP